MSSSTLNPRATSLPLVNAPAWDQQFSQTSSTWISSLGLDEEVTATLGSWGAALVLPQVADVEFPEDEVAAIEYIEEALGVTQKEALSAVRVPKRTYHGWKANGHQPRERAKVRVWTMARAVSGLTAVHENLPAWFHATPEAQTAFKSGEAAKLALTDLEWASAQAEAVRPPVMRFDEVEELSFAEPSATGLVSEDLEDLALRGSDLES